MKRNGYTILAVLSACVMAATITSAAFATPEPNSAVVTERIFNDCGLSTLTTVNSYPGSISFSDDWSDLCVGFANLHNWHFSTDGVSAAVFGNNNDFKFSAIVTISGTGQCEAGLHVGPWYSLNTDGRMQARIPDGEIACFGGRLPFYSFSNPTGHNLRYTGGPILMEIEYHANGLSMGSPATIQYRVVYNSNSYTSGPLPFDQGNPAEDPPHGLWGILDPASAGGIVQTNNGTPPPAVPDATPDRTYDVTFTDILFTCLDCTTPAELSSWGRIKATYR